MALWEWIRSGRIFVKHTYVPQQASISGEALNCQADRMTQPGDNGQSLIGQLGAVQWLMNQVDMRPGWRPRLDPLTQAPPATATAGSLTCQ